MNNPNQDNAQNGPTGGLQKAPSPTKTVRLLPPEPKVLHIARQHASEENLRVGMLSKIVSEDPVIALEILKLANGMFYSAGRTTVSTIHAGVLRLGSDALIEILGELSERQLPAEPQVAHCLNMARFMCKRAGGVARIIAAEVNRAFIEEAEVGGLFVFLGQMLAVDLLRENYVKLAEANPHYKLMYRLSVDHNFDIEARGLSYLEKVGLPESLLFIWDREATPKKKERALLRPICQAAGEIITSYISDGLEKLKPGKNLPSKSAIRLLPLSENDYARLFETFDQFLEKCKMEPEVAQPVAAPAIAETPPADIAAENLAISTNPEESECITIHNETEFLKEEEDNLNRFEADVAAFYPENDEGAQVNISAKSPRPEQIPVEAPGRLKQHRFKGRSSTEKRDELYTSLLSEEEPSFDIATEENHGGEEQTTTATPELESTLMSTTTPKDEVTEKKIEVDFLNSAYSLNLQAAPPLDMSSLGEWQDSVNKIFLALKNCSAILDALNCTAMRLASKDFFDLFKRVIIFQPSAEEKLIKILAMTGDSLSIGELLPVSPGNEAFLQLSIKIQSMGATPSPFGSRGYGLAPLKGPNHPELGLYVDNGTKGAFGFVSRRAFRTIADCLTPRV